MDSFLIGGHVSASGGILKAFDNAKEIGATYAQIFTQSPRMWRSTRISDEDAETFRSRLSDSSVSLTGVVTHASYLINLASMDSAIFSKSQNALASNIESASRIGAQAVVLHVGSHKGLGLDAVLDQIVESISNAISGLDKNCRLLLENTAGQGGSVGVDFKEIKRIIDGLGGDQRIGVCIDTQHLFASGVSFSSIDEADKVMEMIDETIGLSRIGCIHLNDSKVPQGSFRDRHENLGQGFIGESALANFISHPTLREVPIILEVPGSGDGPRKADINKAKNIMKHGLKARANQH